MTEEAEAQGSLTEIASMVANAGTYFVANNSSYGGLVLHHLGITGNNFYGVAVAAPVVASGTPGAATFTYAGFPTDEICEKVATQLQRMTLVNEAVMGQTAGNCAAVGTTFTLTAAMDNTR